MLHYLNRSDGDFRTLGSASGRDGDGLYYSYVEFTLRDPVLAKEEFWPHQFERKWLNWTKSAQRQSQGLVQRNRRIGFNSSSWVSVFPFDWFGPLVVLTDVVHEFLSKSLTEVKMPRLMTSHWMRANQFSTWLSHEEYVGV